MKIVLLRECIKKHVVFWEYLHLWHKFYTAAGRDGRDKSHPWGKESWTLPKDEQPQIEDPQTIWSVNEFSPFKTMVI